MKLLRALTGQIRDAVYEGQSMLVVPIYALKETVIHPQGATCPELVPLRILSAAPSLWNENPVTLNHPTRGGVPISAHDPDVMARYALGTIHRSRIEDGKLCFDAYLDPRRASAIGATSLLAALRSGEVFPVSVGAHVTIANTSGVYGGRRYGAVWQSLQPDHVCILDSTDGACSVNDGCHAGTRAASIDLRAFEPPDPYALSLAKIRRGDTYGSVGSQLIINQSEFNSDSACRDPQIVAAHRLLASIEPGPPPSLTSIRVRHLPDAYARCDRGAISIDPTSPMYQAAEAGDYLPLAMLIAHEDHHAKYGDDESAAFASSLAFLQRHHGDPRLIADVKTHLADNL